MKQITKPFYKQIPLWTYLAAGGLVLFGVLTAIMVGFIGEPEPAPEPTETTALPSFLVENPYSGESFAMDGEFLTCTAGESVLGIDVSYWQGDIDWEQVKSAGIEYVMLRIGWRGSEMGLMFPDDNIKVNYEGAKAAGLKVGGYFFSQAVSTQEAIEEAEFVLDIIKDWELDFPVAFDWEYLTAEDRTGAVSGQTQTSCAVAFCETIRQAGFQPMVYFNPDHAVNRLDLERLTPYGFWLALYHDQLDFPYRVDMWQYTSTGTVPGIQGKVDINLMFSYES